MNAFDSFKLEVGVFIYKHQTKLLRLKSFQIILLNITKFINIRQEMRKITVFKKQQQQQQQMFSDRSVE